MVGNTFIEEYQGIPYAEPPIGDLRFRAPRQSSSWKGTFDATRRLPSCPQLQFHLNPEEHEFSSEDCLRLNIWTPGRQEGNALPVLVWIHGGAFTLGSANAPKSNGTYFAAKTGCVVVSINYRLGIFGFLNANSPEAPGNMGLLDQQLALKWVQENIDGYGGNPSMVTLFGVSAGSLSVNIHIVSPMSRGLFKRAIMEGGSVCAGSVFDTLDDSRRKGNKVTNDVGCSQKDQDIIFDTKEVVSCLRLKSVTDLLHAASVIEDSMGTITFLPTFHDRVLPKAPCTAMKRGFFNNVDVLAGGTSDEAVFDLLIMQSKLLDEDIERIDQTTFYSSLSDLLSSRSDGVVPEMLRYYIDQAPPGNREALRALHIDYWSDKYYNCHMQYFAEEYSKRGNSVYRYIFNHKYTECPVPEAMGVPHGTHFRYYLDIPTTTRTTFTEEDLGVTEEYAHILASFAKYG